jgi:DNA-3-methyladenine glycosylase II
MVIENFSLHAAFPFHLDLTVWALRRRKTNIIDQWDGHQYTRILIINNTPVKVSLIQKNPTNSPDCTIISQDKPKSTDPIRENVQYLLQKMLGLDFYLQPFYALTQNDEAIGPLVRQFSGVKPPRFPTIFEALVNAIACQQVSLGVGIILLNRMAEKFGKAFDDNGTLLYAFPRSEDLLKVSEEEIKLLGFSHQKARAIKELATTFTNNEINIAKLEVMTNQEAVEYLSTLRGIGRWSAEYVLLRGLGRLDKFPGDDIGAQNNLRRLFQLDHKPGYEEIKNLTSRWHPYEGLVYFHLLLNKLHLNGVI